jgi:hypothetical protein
MTTGSSGPGLVPGVVLHLGEEDYRFGVGPLVLRVTEVLEMQRLSDGPWVAVRGVTITWDGRDGDERQVLVRLDAILRRR